MELAECIKTRRSVRRYTDEMVDHDTIEKIIDLARMSPSWKTFRPSELLSLHTICLPYIA